MPEAAGTTIVLRFGSSILIIFDWALERVGEVGSTWNGVDPSNRIAS